MNYPNFDGATCSGIGEYAYYPDMKAMSMENEMAKKLCQQCPVLFECLNWALVHEEHGIWGGTTPNERKVIRKARKITFIPLTATEFVKGLL